jgi:hypothetical protein
MHSASNSIWRMEKHQARLRILKRDHMRRWRAIPENREQERTRQRLGELEQKLKLVTATSGPRFCGFCYQRAPITNVERLIATSRGFRRIFVPYCGAC